MNYAGAVDHAVSRFVAAWANRTPIAYENDTYTPVPGVSWVRVTVRLDSQSLDTLSETRTTDSGQIIVQIFTSRDEGLDEALRLADVARGVFRDSDGVEMWYGATRARVIDNGDDIDPGWYQVNVSTDFEFTEA